MYSKAETVPRSLFVEAENCTIYDFVKSRI